ncbi:MAG: hypothetical protein JST00_36170 [Deltaproteobacteria bacterium]|nr:hypothetical protein [Deltaproteobacteria bacterium]
MKLSSSLFLLASVLVVGCSSEVAEPGGPAAPTSPFEGTGQIEEPGATVGGSRASSVGPSFEVGRVASSEAFVCRKGAFCDDFEGQAGSRWGQSVVEGGEIGRGVGSASLGKGSLSVTTKPGDSRAFLVHEAGEVSATWSGAFSFAVRPAASPRDALGLPELAVKTVHDGTVTIGFALRPEGIYLEQRGSSECKLDRCVTKSKLVGTFTPGTWTRIDLGIEAGSEGVAPFGRLEVKINGGPLVATDLTVPLGNGTAILRAGITRGDVQDANVDLDDVSLLTR